MPTLTHLCGFEFGNILSVNGGGMWFSITGSPTVQSTFVLSGAYSLRINPTAAVQNAQYRLLDASTTLLVGQVRFKFKAWPSVASEIITIDNETIANCRFRLDPADNKIEVSYIGVNPVKSTNALSLETEYVLDFRANNTASPSTIDWSIDGVAQTGTSVTGTGNIVGGPQLGAVTSCSVDLIIDDLSLSNTSGDYPMPAMRVKGLVPSADGTHNNATDVLEDSAGADINGSTVFAYVQIGDMPWSTTLGDRVQCNVAGAANYVEVALPNTGETTIVGVRGYLKYAAAGTQANNGATYVRRSDTTEIAIYGTGAAPADMSESTAFFKSSLITAPGGGWTVGELDALVIRIGRSADATPDPWWEAAMLEYAYDVSAPPTPGVRRLSLLGVGH